MKINFQELYDQHRLLILPCTPGSVIYKLEWNVDACYDCNSYSDFYGMDRICDKYEGEDSDCESFYEVLTKHKCDKHFYEIVSMKVDAAWIVSNMDSFGDWWFSDPESAENKLNCLKND